MGAQVVLHPGHPPSLLVLITPPPTSCVYWLSLGHCPGERGRVGTRHSGSLVPCPHPPPRPSMGHLSIHAPNMAEIPSATWLRAGQARA